eukprot:scaffold77360_cov51-Phaeocystis_antarctica.AAC.2
MKGTLVIAKAYTLFCELHIRANISAGTNITHSPRRPCAREAGGLLTPRHQTPAPPACGPCRGTC